MSIEERVHKLITEHLGADAEQVTNEANLFEDLKADSLDIVELVMAAEEEFAIEIDDDEAGDGKLATVDAWVQLIRAKAGEDA